MYLFLGGKQRNGETKNESFDDTQLFRLVIEEYYRPFCLVLLVSYTLPNADTKNLTACLE